MNNSAAHSKLVQDILLSVGRITGVRIFPRRVGLATPIGTERPVYFGIKGEADLQGFVRIKLGGKIIAACFAIEVKTGKGELSDGQENWREMFEKYGGIYVEARSVMDAVQMVEIMIGWGEK